MATLVSNDEIDRVGIKDFLITLDLAEGKGLKEEFTLAFVQELRGGSTIQQAIDFAQKEWDL